MYIHGQFINNDGDTITVQILNGSKNEEMEIGENGLVFSPNPIEITTNCESLFEHIIRKSCTINLVTNKYLGDILFANNPNQILVNVKKGNQCLFAGYVEPNVYTQPFANEWEELQINCVDVLSNLKYDYLYNDYTDAVENASLLSFTDIINKFNLNRNIDIDELVTPKVWFDKSKQISENNLFSDISISENLFLGDSESDYMNNEDVLFEILQYLNLHIIQIGFDYYIFDWESIKEKDNLILNELFSNETKSISVVNELVTADSSSSNNTSISLDEVYNKIVVKCDLKELETVISSPLDEEDITNEFDNYQLWMQEYHSKENGNGRTALKYWVNNNAVNDFDKQGLNNYFFQVKSNPKWKFYHNGNDIYERLIEKDNKDTKINQWKFLKYSRDNYFMPFLLSIGKENKINKKDDSPTTNLNMEDYLMISVNGELDDSENGLNLWSVRIQNQTPLAEYKSKTSGIYSPLDSTTTNYLVFSGKITLAPLVKNSGYFHSVPDPLAEYTQNTFVNLKEAVNNYEYPHPHYPLAYNYGNDEDWYYIYKFYTQTYSVGGNPICDESNYQLMSYPYIELNNTKQYEFKYSAKGDSTDKISKVPVLECELKIGDKYCVEEYVTDGAGVQHSVFNWYTYENCPTITEDGETVKLTTFSLGFNPAIDDFIIGKQYDIQTNFDYTYNIDAENGTAIPIRKEDNLSGEISFKIVGVVNATWDNVTKKTKRKLIFWKHTSWNTETVSLLSHISNIFIKDFQCKIYSDNSGYVNDADKDLVYTSDVATNNFKTKDGIEMKINTALSAEECTELGIKNSVKLSNVVNNITNLPLANIHNNITDESAKPEELYCDYYYREYYKPKLIVQTDLHTDNNIFKNYLIRYLNKEFYPISQIEDIKNNSINLTLREI